MRKLLFILVAFGSLLMSVYAQSGNTAQLRFAHFAPTLETVTVALDGETVAELSFATVSEWMGVLPGEYTVTFSDEAIAPVSLDISRGEWRTIALASVDSVQILDEDYSPLPEGESRLTVFNTAIPAPPFDMLLDDALFYRALEYGESFTADVVANVYNVGFDAVDGSVMLESQEVDLQRNQNTLIAIVGSEDALEAVIITTPLDYQAEMPEMVSTEEANAGTALMRFAHLSSGTPSIDLYINGRLADFGTVTFPEVTGWGRFAAGTYTLAMTLSGEALEDAVVGPLEVTLTEGMYLTVMAIGTLANNTLEAHIVEDNFTELAANSLRISVLNAYPGLGPVDIQLEDGSQVFIQQLGYPGFYGTNDGYSDFIIEADTYDLQIVTTQDGEELVTLNNTTLIAGRNYFIAVIAANPPFLLTFSDIGEVLEMMEE